MRISTRKGIVFERVGLIFGQNNQYQSFEFFCVYKTFGGWEFFVASFDL